VVFGWVAAVFLRRAEIAGGWRPRASRRPIRVLACFVFGIFLGRLIELTRKRKPHLHTKLGPGRLVSGWWVSLWPSNSVFSSLRLRLCLIMRGLVPKKC
jgi:hypothetical protein